MHPAPSVIIFTVLSGLGFGFLFWLGLGLPAVTGWGAFFAYLIGFVATVGGLLSATFHLGNPQRSLLAFTQWRSSWLSREAWLSVLALVFMGIHAFAAVFFDITLAPIGVIGALLCLATVYATAMIYAQLATVPRWNHWLTPLHLLSLSLAGGAILAGQGRGAVLLLGVAGLVQSLYWIFGDRRFAERGHTMETATGLGDRGTVRLFEAPHTGTNYLLKEMVFTVGRKHAQKLRVIAFVLNCVLPILLIAFLPASLPVVAVAGITFLIGTFASRWLFFAEAEHVVGLYYGKR
ncbi:dimethyl sulfoxide reductase anchor subunit family protein [Roseibium sp.]|uniref:dimethyl sulfoxide reductase anchor subunit family protein n=1 Tax=Roseibium sp. TaxID=1936156 RepID=UPI003B52433F